MSQITFPELFQIAEIDISYRNPTPYQDRIIINKPSLAYDIFNTIWNRDKVELVEQFKILLLNRCNQCLGIVNLATGSSMNCPVDPRLVFAIALKANATAIVLAHNHPTGKLEPTQDDIITTKNIVKAGKLLGIAVMDHIILVSHGYFSFLEHKILPK